MEERACIRAVVEENGEHGFDSYRVPGIVTASNGDLLLTYEGREGGGNRRTLFLRRYQEKNGQLLSLEERIAMVSPEGEELLHNPLLIAAPEGRVYFFWCQDYGRLFLRESRDNGASFGPERELTSLIDGFRKEWPVTLWAIAPGHGICKKDGTLVLPLWLSRGENAHLPACFACLYSVDQGETWFCSNVVPAGNGVGDPTETSVAERADGTLLATMRHEIPGVRRRAFCESRKVAENENALCWGEPWLNQELPDPICGGALLSLSEGKMAFVNCAYGDEPALERQRQGEAARWSPDARQKLTVRLSRDDGKTWSEGVLLAEEGGASDLAGTEPLYCFYEEGWQDGNCIFNRRLMLAEIPSELL
ncbi:MAG: sialidase family protein [Clostridium sp.]|nr:sialidase family protein [Clostridium sp.]